MSRYHWSKYVVHFFGQEPQFRGKRFFESMCTPKECGGLGLCRLFNLNQVYCLKIIWLLFDGTRSFWIAWAKKNIVAWKMFWISDFQNIGNLEVGYGSTLWNCQLCKMSFTLWTMSSFWNDDWTELWSLLEVMGPNSLVFPVSQL